MPDAPDTDPLGDENAVRPLLPLNPVGRTRLRVLGRQVSGSARVLGDAAATRPCPGSGMRARDPERLTERCPRCGERVTVDHGDVLMVHTAREGGMER